MSKAKSRDRERRQIQWERERDDIQNFRMKGIKMKAFLRSKGFDLPFFDCFDSYEDEFKKLVNWAKIEFPSLHNVYELSREEFEDNDWQKLGLPSDWEQVFFNIDDESAKSYLKKKTDATLEGCTVAFLDGAKNRRTIIKMLKNPQCKYEHKEYKYLWNLPVLLHEIGHVKDHHENINFKPNDEIVDIIEAEVFANLFALNECYRRSYFMSGDFCLESLTQYQEATDYRGEVVRRLLQRFQKPPFVSWQMFYEQLMQETEKVLSAELA